MGCSEEDDEEEEVSLGALALLALATGTTLTETYWVVLPRSVASTLRSEKPIFLSIGPIPAADSGDSTHLPQKERRRT